MWEKQRHKPPMTGNGKHTIYFSWWLGDCLLLFYIPNIYIILNTYYISRYIPIHPKLVPNSIPNIPNPSSSRPGIPGTPMARSPPPSSSPPSAARPAAQHRPPPLLRRALGSTGGRESGCAPRPEMWNQKNIGKHMDNDMKWQFHDMKWQFHDMKCWVMRFVMAKHLNLNGTLVVHSWHVWLGG